jgi:hypothetical protein
LPTGHTHEDIDACFALIWMCFRTKTCETLEMYKQIIENAFKDSALNANMIDVYVIPNFQFFFAGCIDGKLQRLHKDLQTQHQWRFEAVKPTSLFPTGCKTTYKAYSSDKVVEFVKKPKSQCLSIIGQYTGLEATTLHCCWYPSRECDAERNVEGFYLLRSIPHSPTDLPPFEFPDKVHESIAETMSEVRKTYDIYDDVDIRTSWDNWYNMWAPKTDDSKSYIESLKSKNIPFHIPLKLIILNKDNYVKYPNWEGVAKVTVSNINPDFVWPEVIAAAMNSVLSDFNPNPRNPRLYSTTDADLTADINFFRERCNDYFNSLKTLTNNTLKIMLKRKIGYTGEVLSTTGNF